MDLQISFHLDKKAALQLISMVLAAVFSIATGFVALPSLQQPITLASQSGSAQPTPVNKAEATLAARRIRHK